jgi:DNA modification methylase
MNKILLGDCRDTLKTLEAGSVQTCVTSPPYYGLRDYGVGGQIGLEETPEEYVNQLVEVFREVRRVLADDGTLWLNLGDSYASMARSERKESPGVGAKQELGKRRIKLQWGGAGSNFAWKIPTENYGDIKPKDLLGIPWMVAFALRADGWYLRSDIIWHKPNPMPESVTDRPTKSHEYIFLLSKSAQYYYDYEAIMEPVARIWGENNIGDNNRINTGVLDGKVLGRKENPHGGLAKTMPKTMSHKNLLSDGQLPHSMHQRRADGLPDEQYPGRNKRSVWTVTTKPYKEAHFATFPPDLIEPCILAGSRVGDTVLDPFGGSGTTAAVAIKHHRNYVICELNPSYIQLAEKRLAGVQPVLFGVTS